MTNSKEVQSLQAVSGIGAITTNVLAGVWHKRFDRAGWVRFWHLAAVTPTRGAFSLWAPWFFCTGAAAYFFPLTEPSAFFPFAIIVLCLVCGALLLRQNRIRTVWLVFALGLAASFAAGWGTAQWRGHARAAPVLTTQSKVYKGEGLVLAVDKERGHRARYLIAPQILGRLKPEQIPKRIRVSGFLKDAEPGDQVRFTAALQAPPAPKFNGAYNFSRAAWFQQIGGTGFSYGHIHPTADENGITDKTKLRLTKIRRALALRIRDDLGGQKGAVAAALVTGDRSVITEQTAEDLRAAGLAHMLAISGLHMGLVAGLVFAASTMVLAAIPAIGRRYDARKPAAIIGLFAAVGYLLLSGGSAPTQRAFVMTAVVFIAVLFNRRALSIRTISLSALVVVALAPESVVSPGFQMSFAAALSLIAFYEWARGRFRVLPLVSRSWTLTLLMRAVAILAALALTSFIAGLATGPFAAFYFHRTATYGLLANIAAMPVFTFIVMPSLLAGTLLDAIGAGAPFFTIAGWGLDIIMNIAHGIAQLPGALVRLPAASSIVLGLIALGLLSVCLLQKFRRAWGLVPIIFGMVLWINTPQLDGIITKDGGALRIQVNGTTKVLGFGTFSRFEVEQFASVLAINPDDAVRLKKAAKQIPCDVSGCTARLNDGRLVVINRELDQLSEDCRFADLVFLERIPTVRNAQNCPSRKLIALTKKEGQTTLLYLNGHTKMRPGPIRTRLWSKP